MPYTDFTFTENDILIAGRESAGVPLDIHQGIESRITIPMAGETRSLNIINATAMITGEALRQTSHTRHPAMPVRPKPEGRRADDLGIYER